MELTIEQALQKAVEAHKVGKLQDAEVLYRAILQSQPKHPDANHNLGVMAVSLNKTEAAIPLFKIALEANPTQGQFWLSYVDALIKEKEFDRAISALEQGKKRGLTGEKVDLLEAQLSSIFSIQKQQSLLKNKNPIVTQQRKKTTKKKDKKNNTPRHLINLNQSKNPPQIELNTPLEHYKNGQYDLAQHLATTLTQQYPNHPFGWKLLGASSKEIGKLQDSLIANQKVLKISPSDAEAHSNLGSTLQALGRLEEAETSYKKAIAIKPDYAGAHSNLGITLQVLGRLEEAETSYKKAIAIKPDYADAHSNLGNTLQALGRLEDALTTVIKSIKIKPTLEAKKLFVQITKKIDVKIWNQSLADLVINALLEPWSRPSDLMSFACILLKVDKEFVQILNRSEDDSSQARGKVSFLSSISKKEFNASSLLQAMLSSSPIPNAEIERFLTFLRHHLLKVAPSETLKEADTEALTPLYCSLAKQCFINEYVYFQTAEEINLSHQLRDRLIKALEEGGSVSADLVIAVACYFPLCAIAGSEKLLHQKWSDEVKSVLKQQIQEPLEELNLRASIPILTSIDNQVSLAVQSQYEENPYPRWVRLQKDSSKKSLNTYIQSKFPLSPFRRLVDDRNPEILIAGCGTGQHSIGTSQQYKGARILAVDLSMSSLAYAKRKTTELDIEFIEYAQADLLKLASLGRTFDVIESSGVLHHLENPFEGWEVLLSLLRPHGLMRLGFYSELARQDIVRVRNIISEEGIGSTSQEIRDYRKHLLVLNDSEDYGFAVSSSDFFSTSACRDLLFHVQEHRMNLKILAVFFKDHDLNFLGFDIDSSVIRAYKNRFPNDPSATNLDQWHIYEEENPNTFATMYQFWIQKK